MPDASVTLGLNAAELYSELNAAIGKFQTGMNRMAGGAGIATGATDRLTHGHERLFTSSHRVANRIGTLTQALVSGGGAADIMAVGIEGLGRSLNLPLGILAGLAAVGVLTAAIYKSQSEVAKLKEQIAALGAGNVQNPRSQSLESLKKQAEDAKKSLEELKKAHDSIVQTILRGIGSIGATRKEDKDDPDLQAAKIALRRQRKRGEEGQATKETQRIEQEETKFTTGDHAAELARIKQVKDEKISAAQAVDEVESAKQHRTVFEVSSPKTRAEMIANAKREADLATAVADKKLQASQREVAMENELNAIKANGVNVEERSIEVKAKYAALAVTAAAAEDKPKAVAALQAQLVALEQIVREREKSHRLADEETSVLEAQLHGWDDVGKALQEAAATHERIVEAIKQGDTVLAEQLAKQEKIKAAMLAQKAAGGATPAQRERTALNERREIRDEDKREKELKNQLSNEGDPRKREELKDELEDIQLKRQERADKHAQEQAAAEAAAQKAAQDKAQADEAARAEGQKKQDESEVKEYGHVLSPQERASEESPYSEKNLKAQQDAYDKQQQDQTQNANDQLEASGRGISVEQLRNERNFKSREQQAQAGSEDKGKDAGGDLKSAAAELKAAAGELKQAVTIQ